MTPAGPVGRNPQGLYLVCPDMTVGLLAEWSQWMSAGGMSIRTITDRVQLVERFEASAQVDSLDAGWRDVARFLACDRFSAGTRQTYYAHLCTWFAWLVLMEYRPDNPTAKLRAPARARRRPRPTSLEQLTRILNTRMHHRTRAMVLLGAYEGLRVSEIATFRGEQLAGGELRVTGKGGVEADLPIHELVAAIAETMPAAGYWFPSPTRPGRPIKGNSVSGILGQLMKRAGVPGTPHSLRHFFGTETLRASGGNLIVTKELMRHANVATTAMYTEIDSTARTAAVRGLPVPIAA